MLKIICPRCQANNWKYSGYTRIKDSGEKAQRFFCKDCRKEFLDKDILSQFSDIDLELLRENIRLAKQRQRFEDSNRVERQSFRNYGRLDNAVSDYNQELIKLLEKNNLAEFTIKHNYHTDMAVGILHFTDAHFNELVNLAINKYDFNIASKRCQLFIDEARHYFRSKNIHRVLFAITGDVLNSDRRLEELLAQATNRSKATFLATRIIELMLLDLNEDFDVVVASVTGNESRIHKYIAWNDIVATDSYDFTIFNILEYLFRGSKGIQFIKNEDPLEQIVKVCGRNILLIHGHTFKGNIERAVQGIKGKYASRGVMVDFVLFGHLHSSLISDTFARGSSLVGANEYSDRDLQLTSKASQNIHIVYSNGRIDSIKIDLQNVQGIEGYNIEREIESYNAKSSNIMNQNTIYEVKI